MVHTGIELIFVLDPVHSLREKSLKDTDDGKNREEEILP